MDKTKNIKKFLDWHNIYYLIKEYNIIIYYDNTVCYFKDFEYVVKHQETVEFLICSIDSDSIMRYINTDKLLEKAKTKKEVRELLLSKLLII